MVFSLLSAASALALLSVASAQSYPANTNTACGTASDVNYQDVYYYSNDDLMDWGLYTQSQGTCDTGSYARVHMIDPYNNDIDCGYVALDGKLNLLSCPNYPRAYMPEGQYTLYWETVPGISQYSWNQFTVTHTQATITGPVPTSSVTTTPITVLTTTIVNTATDTSYLPQVTITKPSATQVNTVKITPLPTTITTTTTSWYTVPVLKYAYATVTAYTTAPCRVEKITTDFTAKRGTTTTTTTTVTSRQTLFDWIARLAGLRRRGDDQPNTVGMPGPPRTTTITPPAVITTITAATSTSIVTSVSDAPKVIVTVTNPTPTYTMLSGVAVQTTTVTLAQVTKSVVKSKLSLTVVTNTSTLTLTKKAVTTPVCKPTAI